VGPDHFSHLISDAQDGIERYRRLLKDQGYLRTPDLLDVVPPDFEQISASKEHRAPSCPRIAGKKAQQSEGRGRFPATRLAEQTNSFAGMDLECDACKRAALRSVTAIAHSQITYLKQRVRHFQGH
jgi:hypothetical protein